MFITDVFGWQFNNSRVLADKYAQEAGVKVYIPDFFDGDHAPYDKQALASFDTMGFIGKHHPRQVFDRVETVAKEIKATSKAKKLISIGFCWGAPSALYLGRENGVADAVGFAHPSLTEDVDFEQLTKPALFLTSEHDSIFTPEKFESAKRITSTKANKEPRVYTSWHTFMGTSHGFAVRGDENDSYTARAMSDACAIACNFFKSI